MSDAVFFLLDGLLSAARGMLATNRAKSVQEEYSLKEDPRSGISRILTSPIGSMFTGLIGTYFINKDLVSNAENQAREGRYFRNF